MYKFILLHILLLHTTLGVSKTYYVSTNGNNQNEGSSKSPFRTISKAASLAQPGDTVFVREGIYRERVAPPRGGIDGKPIVYWGEPNKQVFIKGSDNWQPKWEKMANGIYKAIPDETLFNDDSYVDNKNPFKVESAATPYGREGKPEVALGFPGDTTVVYTCGQVFVDGTMYIQKPFLKEMQACINSWFYDKKTGNIYVNFLDDNPSSHKIEISTRRRIFAPHTRGLAYITVQGFILEHCGNQYPKNFWQKNHPEWQQAGAIGTRSGNHWIIKSNIIRYANGIGVDFGNEGATDVDSEKGNNGKATGSSYHLIDRNYIIDNGAGGTAAFYPDYITFTNNVVERNNTLLYRGLTRWETAGVKMHAPNYSLIANNLIRNNTYQWGLWLDQGSGKDTRVHGNLIVGNGIGFDLEIGADVYPDKLIFDNNILIDNGFGISSRDAGGITAFNNLVINSLKIAIRNSNNKKRGDAWAGDYQHYFNNLIINSKSVASVCAPDYYRSTDRRFDYNYYDVGANERKFNFFGVPDSLTFSQWQSKWSHYNQNTNADLGSKLIDKINYSFDQNTLILKLIVDTNLSRVITLISPKVVKDYFDRTIPKNGTAKPGPFQDLKQGSNQYKLWSGLKPLGMAFSVKKSEK